MSSGSLLERDRWMLKTLGAACALAALGSLASRLSHGSGAAAVDEALDFLVSLVLPILGFLAFDSIAPTTADAGLLRFGLDRKKAFLARFIHRLAVFTGAFTVVAAALLVAAHSPRAPQLPRDLVATLPVCALAALCIGACFSAAILGGGRWALGLAIAAFWLLGHASGPVALAVPVGQIRHLLALGPDWGVPSTACVALLVGSAAIASASCAWRVPR